MDQLIVAISPFVVKYVANWTKPVKEHVGVLPDNSVRRLGVRAIVGVLSIIIAVLTAVLSGGEIDMMSIETGVNALLNFIGATGLYYLNKTKVTE